jgi:CRISPR-associated RAMP protein (TIGR02581 family)
MMNRTFRKKYVFNSQLILTTGLHIGGGQNIFSVSDSPVIRTPDGKPFIPGSSFKGAFRSTVEKLAPVAGLWSCGLSDAPVMVNNKEKMCVGVQGKAQNDFNSDRNAANWSEDELIARLDGELCDTCKLFGSPYTASKINFSDLYTDEDTEGVIQIRDGVAIDRDSERAVDSLLYNYEVVASELIFNLKITLEDPSDLDLQLTCLGLAEFRNGFGVIGGKRSRGLGQVRLENLVIYNLDLTGEDAAKRLLNYLTNKDPNQKMEQLPKDFVDKQIESLLEGQGHA